MLRVFGVNLDAQILQGREQLLLGPLAHPFNTV